MWDQVPKTVLLPFLLRRTLASLILATSVMVAASSLVCVKAGTLTLVFMKAQPHSNEGFVLVCSGYHSWATKPQIGQGTQN